MTPEQRRRAMAARAALGLGARAAKRRRQRLRKMPRQVWPTHIAREYRRELLDLVDRIRAAAEPLFSELPELLRAVRLESARADAGEGQRARELLESLQLQAAMLLPTQDIEDLAVAIAEATSAWSRAQLRRQIKHVFGVDPLLREPQLQARIEAFAADNVLRIKAMPTKTYREIGHEVMRAVTGGTRWETLAEIIEERFSVMRSEARFIARDQVGRLYGQIAATRQKALGITSFVWQTVGDRRVRPEHRARQGRAYKFADPPAGELPGEPYNCRCYPDPVLEQLLEAAGDDDF